MRLAAKLLAEVEVSADSSHQHELNAGLLRQALELPEETLRGTIDLTYLARGQEDPFGETSSYTLYNAREGKPRTPEYRLYLDSRQFQDVTRPGDILLISRPGDGVSLRALVVPADSALGTSIARVLSDKGTALEQRFRRISSLVDATDLTALLQASSDPALPHDQGLMAHANESFVQHALQVGRIPNTRDMADEAVQMVRRYRTTVLDPDAELHLSLLAETVLFQHIEKELGQRALDRLGSTGHMGFEDVAKLIMGLLQSRKSRRGQSLQHHFRRLLDYRGIQYTAQCRTERNETPDFVIPGFRAYHDSAFPAERLRMVACKSTLKERWGQVLKEADRIHQKYVLTLDSTLTDDLIRNMSEKQLHLFLPGPIITESYSGRPVAMLLAKVADLLDYLAAA